MLVRLLCLGILLPAILSAQNRIGTGAVAELYQQHCASCHGEDLNDGLGGSLISGPWDYIGDDLSFIEYVEQGNLDQGMPPFKDVLNRKQIRSLEIFVDEMRQKHERELKPVATRQGQTFQAGGVGFLMEILAEGLELPWALSFLPDGRGLFTLKRGELYLLDADGATQAISGIPDDVWVHGQGGLMEVAPHPDYEVNGWVYLGYAASGGERKDKPHGMTKIVRGRIDGTTWKDQETIFEAPFELHLASGAHFGTRFVFQGGYLFFGIGDRGAQNQAQDLSRPNGKIHRVHEDGRIPQDNPFVNEPGAFPTIWTYGNRNPQGLDLHPVTGALWESEHGPRGGDEINRIEQGNNYGWPVITYGMNYSGTPITDKTEAPGMEQPKLYWTPSIAVCGMDFYEGELFPDWKHDLFVGGLASQELHRLRIESGEVVLDEIVLSGEGRIRDVASGPDGALYLVLNRPGRIAKLLPAE